MDSLSIARRYIPEKQRQRLNAKLFNLLAKSIKCAVRQQGFDNLYAKLENIVPDISDQYSGFVLDTDYLKTNVRALHAFQIHMVKKALDVLALGNGATIVDIGDSSGTHLAYIQGLFGEFKALSVNIDINAVRKIQAKGLAAIHSRAEALKQEDIPADLFLSFEMLEHLNNPLNFLHDLSSQTDCKGFVVTVPYVAQSRVGLHHLRRKDRVHHVSAENTHIFELSPKDWRLLFMHSGWKIKHEQIYLQYPHNHLLGFTKPLWKKLDFEGFYGAILVRDDSWSKLYGDW